MTEERLTPAQLKRELQRIAWGQVRLAQKLGVWPSEVRDWLAGEEPVPEVVALDIRHLPSHNLRPPRPRSAARQAAFAEPTSRSEPDSWFPECCLTPPDRKSTA